MIRAIYKTGSSLILNNSNDNDLVYFFDTKEESKTAVDFFKKENNNGADIHFDYVREPSVFLGCYIYHFMELVKGKDLHLADFSVFDHKEEYMALLKRYAEWLPQDNKKWYHILTAYYMYKNESYELTETQLKAIQKAHDEGITNAKYNLCIEWLGVVL